MPSSTNAQMLTPFADMVALYSQHLVRPSRDTTSSRPQQARGGQRRPRSAAAVLLSSRRQPTAIYGSSSLTSNCHNKTQGLADTRPSSAEATTTTTTAQARRPTRPTRPRPSTASDTGSASTMSYRSTSTGHRRNHGRPRVVSAGSPPSVSKGIVLQAGGIRSHDKQRPDYAACRKRTTSSHKHNNRGITTSTVNTAGDLLEARGPAWGYDLVGDAAGGCSPMEEGGGENTCSNTGSFWHKHDNLGSDPTVMQRAEEFVAEILRANNEKPVRKCQQLQLVERPAAAVPLNLNLRPSNCQPRKQGARQNKRAKNSRRESSIRLHDRWNAQRHRNKARRRAGTGKAGGRKHNLVRATQVEADGKSTPIEANIAVPSANATDGDFPCPSIGDSRNDNIGTDCASRDVLIREQGRRCYTVGKPGSLDSDAIGGGTTDFFSHRKEENIEPSRMVRGKSCMVTPLALDIFCAMRPTLKHPMSARTKGSLSTGYYRHSRGNRPKACVSTTDKSQHSGRNSRNTSPIIPPSSALSRDDHKVAAPWTSVFGAVCAGAARGRVLAEVLKTARREASRRRRSASLSVCVRAPTLAEANSVTAEATPGARTSPPASAQPKAANTANEDNGGGQREDNDSVSHSPTHSATLEALAIGELPAGTTTMYDGATGVAGSYYSVAKPIFGEEIPSGGGEHRGQNRKEPNGAAGSDEIILETNVVTGGHCQASSAHSFRLSTAVACTATSPPIENQQEISPIFRNPCGRGSTRVTVSAPRSLQVSPGGRGFSGIETSAYSPVRRHREQRSSSRRRTVQRPWTAGVDCNKDDEERADACAGCSFRTAEMGPKTAGSFFPGTHGNQEGPRDIGVRPSYSVSRGSTPQNPRHADGANLCRQVIKIAGSIAKEIALRGGGKPSRNSCRATLLGDVEEEHRRLAAVAPPPLSSPPNRQEGPADVVEDRCDAELNRDVDVNDLAEDIREYGAPGIGQRQHSPFSDGATCPSPPGSGCCVVSFSLQETISPTTKPPPLQPEDDVPRETAAETRSFSRPTRGSSLNSCTVGTAESRAPDKDTIGSIAARKSGTDDDSGNASDRDDGVPTTPVTGAAALTTTTAVEDAACVHLLHASNNKRQRPASAPAEPSVAVTGRRQHSYSSGASRERPLWAGLIRPTKSSPGLIIQGTDRRSTAPTREDASHPITEGATTDSLACRRNSRDEVSDGVFCGVAPATACFRKDGEAGTGAQRVESSSRIDGVAGTGGTIVRRGRRRRQRETNDSVEATTEFCSHDQLDTPRGVRLPPRRKERKGFAVSGAVKTSLDFLKATVQLKQMAAETNVAVDKHDDAWRVSKEEAEALFNDRRLAAEEDAQNAASGAESEIRRNLRHIVAQSGLEESTRVEREAALEEIQRVLAQDDRMYAARTTASERMMQELRVLEEDNDAADMSLLLESKTRQTLLMVQERTERERDEQRAACRRLREEANVMGATLEEARHARGRLIGHVQHLVERLSCLAEHVTITRHWCQRRLEERAHARSTSEAIMLEFKRRGTALNVRVNNRGKLVPRGGEVKTSPAMSAPAIAAYPMGAEGIGLEITEEDVVALLPSTVTRLRALLKLCESFPPKEDAADSMSLTPPAKAGVKSQT